MKKGSIFQTLSLAGILAGGVGLTELAQSSAERVFQPKPPRLEDVNHDGEEDLIVQQKVWLQNGPLGIYWPNLVDMVLYGTGTELNSKPLYLPKDLFDQYMAK